MRPEKRREVAREFQQQLVQYGSPAKLAHHLGISRSAVYARMKRFGITPDQIRSQKKVNKRVDLYRKVFKLRYMDNEELSDIATRLGVDLRSVALIHTAFLPLWVTQTLEESLTNLYSSNIRLIRSLQKMTQSELAQRAGLQQEYISEVENGHHRTTNKTLTKIAEGLGVELSVLLRPLTVEVVERALKEESVDKGHEQSG